MPGPTPFSFGRVIRKGK